MFYSFLDSYRKPFPQGAVSDPYPRTALQLCVVGENKAAQCSSAGSVSGKRIKQLRLSHRKLSQPVTSSLFHPRQKHLLAPVWISSEILQLSQLFVLLP